MDKTNLPDSLLSHTPWERSEGSIWLSTNLILRRNFLRYCFPQKLSDLESRQIFDVLKQKFQSAPSVDGAAILDIEQISPADREYLFEHFMTIDSFGPLQNKQAFIVDRSVNFLGCINIGDHLVLECFEPSENWPKAWEKLSNLENYFGTPLEYAYSSRFGFLTADPAFCGTGLTAQAFLHLPAIFHMGRAEEAFANELDEEIFPRSLSGDEKDFVGDFAVLQNKYCLGITEDAILNALQSSASKLVRAEETLRKHILEQNSALIKDKISRAYGLLAHSYQLETKEVLAALSLIKLGLFLGWIENISQQKINEIFFKCRRAHLLFFKDSPVSQEELPHKRAEFLHAELKEAKLLV